MVLFMQTSVEPRESNGYPDQWEGWVQWHWWSPGHRRPQPGHSDHGSTSRTVRCPEKSSWRTIVQHVEGRYGKRGNTMCITVPVEERDKRFILGSGSGHDLISSTRISRMDLPTYDDKVVNFHTANGVTCSTKRSSIKFEAFNEPAEAHILEDTPSVISMGKRVRWPWLLIRMADWRELLSC